MARTLLYCIWAGTNRSLIGHRSLLAERVSEPGVREVVDVPRVVLGVDEERHERRNRVRVEDDLARPVVRAERREAPV